MTRKIVCDLPKKNYVHTHALVCTVHAKALEHTQKGACKCLGVLISRVLER